MRKLLALLIVVGGLAFAQAQNFTTPPPGGVVIIGAQVVSACGNQSLAVSPAIVTIDATGKLCVNSVGGTQTVVVSGTIPATVQLSNIYPLGATPVTASGTGTSSAVTISLGSAGSKTTYICGFTITANALALATGTATVSGTISGSLQYLESILAATNGVATTSQNYNPCIPASATNVPVSVITASAGTSGNTAVDAWGFQQ